MLTAGLAVWTSVRRILLPVTVTVSSFSRSALLSAPAVVAAALAGAGVGAPSVGAAHGALRRAAAVKNGVGLVRLDEGAAREGAARASYDLVRIHMTRISRTF